MRLNIYQLTGDQAVIARRCEIYLDGVKQDRVWLADEEAGEIQSLATYTPSNDPKEPPRGDVRRRSVTRKGVVEVIDPVTGTTPVLDVKS